ncbi:MAG TPA: hypothetical protein VJU59_08120 [Paraburkholderia sp.]|uniref:hypothetical protein n=1 Tax=Paraburkholderia sp. TaxID=1926495 RepID=UPI002B46F884|nr:hypothetical protein [Paraburkholderia sp.]HKR39632.1 hypothetical protein [Paraburkholderia sp.]
MDQLQHSEDASSQQSARAAHDEMRTNGRSNYELGLFYRNLISKRIWTTQKELASALRVSPTIVSRLISLTRIPADVVDAMGTNSITYRTGQLLLRAIDSLGERVVVERALDARSAGYSAVDDLLEYVVADRLPEQDITMVRVRVGRDNRSLRVEVRDLSRLMPHLSRLAEWLSRAIAMFEASLITDVTVAAKVARDARAHRRLQAARRDSQTTSATPTSVESERSGSSQAEH